MRLWSNPGKNYRQHRSRPQLAPWYYAVSGVGSEGGEGGGLDQIRERLHPYVLERGINPETKFMDFYVDVPDEEVTLFLLRFS